MYVYLYIQESVQFVGDESLYVFRSHGISTVLRVGASLSGPRFGLKSVVPNNILAAGGAEITPESSVVEPPIY